MDLLRSADAAENDAEDQHDDGDAAVDIFAQALDETTDAIFAAHLDLAGSEAFAADPEEHDPGEQRANWHDVDGEDVHPAGNGVTIFQEDANEQAEAEDDDAGRDTAETKLFLQRFDRRFIEIDKARDAGEEYRQEENDGQDLRIWQLRKD